MLQVPSVHACVVVILGTYTQHIYLRRVLFTIQGCLGFGVGLVGLSTPLSQQPFFQQSYALPVYYGSLVVFFGILTILVRVQHSLSLFLFLALSLSLPLSLFLYVLPLSLSLSLSFSLSLSRSFLFRSVALPFCLFCLPLQRKERSALHLYPMVCVNEASVSKRYNITTVSSVSAVVSPTHPTHMRDTFVYLCHQGQEVLHCAHHSMVWDADFLPWH